MRFLLWMVLVWIGFFVNAQTPVEWVNPFIGSANYGTTNPGAIVPQGMVSVTPFNVTGSSLNKHDKDIGWWSTPYAHVNSWFAGFSHVNLSGVGCPELGVILMMPTTGEVAAEVENHGSEMANQKASPGFYSVDLPKYNIHAQATATQRVGVTRLKFPEGNSNVLINLGVGLTNETGGMVKVVNSTEIEGWRMTGNFCYNAGSERPVYFVARFSRVADSFGVWKKMPEMKTEAAWSNTSGKYAYYNGFTSEMAGDSIGAWMTFNTQAGDEVLVKVGVSYVSIANARLNLDTEMPDYDFDRVHQAAREQWNSVLSKIMVEGGTPEQKTIFYTALYHMHIHPNVLNDVDGRYPAMESGAMVRLPDGQTRYTVFSLWDTYRNLHPFMALVYPEKQLNMVRSMVAMYHESGWLPKWELNSRETHVMEGDPAIPVIVDTYLRGLTDFDVSAAYEAMVKSATTKGADNKLRPDNDDYLNLGYVPLREQFDNSVSHALEYYIADWNLAQFAKSLGKTDDYKRFLNQSLKYKNYFDREFMMIRPKMPDGSFYKPFNPRQGENFEPSPGFHEGNAWQYTFYVPHDIQGLMTLMGGSKAFVNKLQKVFDDNLFDMANEPDINYPYLFNFVKGEEWRTQKMVRHLIDSHYHNAPGGIPGNDDCGTLSSWLVYSMMGFYPVCPGDMRYALTTPVFDRVVIHLDSNYYPGKQFEIVTHRNSKSTGYIDKMVLNGKSKPDYFLLHKKLTEGGKLEFFLK